MQHGDEAPSSPRIAVVLAGDATDPRTWSGVPAGLSSGLVAAGAEPFPIDARFPGAAKVAHVLGMSWVDEATNPVFAAGGGFRASTAIRTVGRIDGAVMMGSGYSLAIKAPIVTFEDMTVVQALDQPGPPYASVSEPAARRWRARQRRNYRHSRGCCVASRWAARSVHEDYGVDPAKIHVVGFGRNAEPQLVNRDWKTPHFLFVGGDWERKRGPAVVEAFAEVRRHQPNATLDLVGGHPAIDVPGVTGHGMLSLGTAEGREQHAALLARATCMVLPSAYEPFGITYLDAGATGAPSIGTTVGGAPGAVGDGGVVVDPHDQDALVRAMLELADPSTAKAHGERAFAHSSLFTWQAFAERLLRALRPAGVDISRLAGFLES
jgi:glycosyltransferase involved in cell wall biosynthesis